MRSISPSHFVAETYPKRPGTTRRVGNPWANGRGWPFMPSATTARRPSVATSDGEAVTGATVAWQPI